MNSHNACFCLSMLCSVFLFAGEVSGKSYETTIYRDGFGVPHIVADSLPDAAFGDGYAQAQDRMKLVMDNILQATGTRAAVLGKRFVRQDYGARLTGARRLAYEAWDGINPEVKAILEGFAAGVNQFMEDHPEGLPPNARQIDAREILALNQFMLLARQFNQARQDRRRQGAVPISGEGGVENTDGGSNGWVLAPSRTVSGNPIVLCDPHTPWSSYNRWYEKHYITPEVNIYGSMTTGVPLFLYGTSDHVSWTLTRNPGDRGDCFAVEVVNKRKYKFDGKPMNFVMHEEVIEVKGADPVRRQVLHTIHGPVFEREGMTAFVAGMSMYKSDFQGDELLGWMLAKDVYDFKDALMKLEADGANVFVADAKGNYGYFWINRMMVRNDAFHWLEPVDGSNAESRYKGVLPFERLPQSINDKGGYYQASNAANWMMPEGAWGMKSGDFPRWLHSYNNRQYFSARPQRVVDLIESRPKHSLQQAMVMALDSRVVAAEWAMPALELGFKTYGEGSKPEVGEATEILRSWVAEGAETNGESRGYTIFRELAAQVGGNALPDFRNAFGVKGFSKKKVKVLYDKLVATVDVLMEENGTVSIAWEKKNVIRLADGTAFPCGAGDAATQTVWQGTQRRKNAKGQWQVNAGSDFMMATEMSQPPVIHTLVPYGQSDDPNSPHFADQTERWINGQWKRAWFTEGDVKANAKSKTIVRHP